MAKLNLSSINDIANPLLQLANLGGEEFQKMVAAGLVTGTALEAIAAFFAPQLVLGVGAIGTLGGMLIEYLRGRKEKQMALAMANDGLTPEGPAFICGENGAAELQAVQQQTMENGR